MLPKRRRRSLSWIPLSNVCVKRCSARETRSLSHLGIIGLIFSTCTRKLLKFACLPESEGSLSSRALASSSRTRGGPADGDAPGLASECASVSPLSGTARGSFRRSKPRRWIALCCALASLRIYMDVPLRPFFRAARGVLRGSVYLVLRSSRHCALTSHASIGSGASARIGARAAFASVLRLSSTCPCDTAPRT